MRKEGRPSGVERFLYRGDAHGQRRRAYERKRVFLKEKRRQSEPTTEQRVIRLLLELSEKPAEQSGQLVASVAERLLPFIASASETVEECLTDCVVELPSRTPHYAALAGCLWRGDGEAFVAGFVGRAWESFSAALAESDRLRARMLLRFFVSLVPERVLDPAPVRDALRRIAESALETARGAADRTGRSWQPYTDYLVYAALLTLPWGAASLFEDEADWVAFSDAVDAYVGERAMQRDAATAPFLAAAKENDPAAQSDSGGPAFVAELWTAAKELRSAPTWRSCGAVPRVECARPSTVSVRSASVCTKLDTQEGRPGIRLEGLEMPKLPPGCAAEMSVAERASVVSRRYPPRGGIRLLDAERTHPEAPEMDRIVVEEYVLDTLSVYQGSRADCVKRIVEDVPAPFPVCPLVAQTLFSQMLMLPRPPLKPVAYSAVIVDLCKTGGEAWSLFPRGLSACVREVYSRMPVLDPELSVRVSDWLSMHLPNLGYMWPWSRWKSVVESGPMSAQRIFVQRTLRRLADASSLKTVRDNLSPVDFHALLPPEPSAKPFVELFGVAGAAVEAQGDAMEVDGAPDLSRLSRLGDMVSSKEPADAVIEAFPEELSGPPDRAAAFMEGACRVLLLCGDKNVTHVDLVLTRYEPFLKELASRAGDAADGIWICAATDVWEASAHRSELVLALLMQRSAVAPTSVAKWALERLGTSLGEGADRGRLWELLDCAVTFSEARLKAAEDERAVAARSVEHARESAEDAARRAAEAAELLETGGSESVQETIDAINEASAAEEAARDAVADAEARLREAEADGERDAREGFRALFLQVVRGFVGLLKEKPEGDDAAQFDRRREHYRALSRLGAFCRRHSDKAVVIVSQLEECLRNEGASDEAQAAVWNGLRLGRDVVVSKPLYEIGCFARKKDPAAETA